MVLSKQSGVLVIYSVLKKYLRYHRVYISAWAINSFIYSLFYILTFESNKMHVYPVILSASILFAFLLISYIKFSRFHKCVKHTCENTLYTTDNLEEYENEVIDGIAKVHVRYIREIENLKLESQKKNIYFSRWVHEMKTPISVISLILERVKRNKNDLLNITEIRNENEKLCKLVDDSLNYIRLNQFIEDYKPKKVCLEELVKDVINENKILFIHNNVFPKIEVRKKGIFIFTDRKWSKFVIKQIMDNSVKYSKKQNNSKEVKFVINEEDNNVILKVIDQGIGISDSDINRIFKPFFTGNTGVLEHKSTGMGLYLVDSILKKLNHQISVSSRVNEGTIVKITF